MARPVIGMQLYSLRDFEKTEDDFARTMEKVAAIGYTTVQISGIGDMPHEAVARITKENGLKIAATHVGWQSFLDDLDAVIDQHKLWECSHPAIGGLFSGYEGVEGIEKFKRELTPVAERLAAEGMTFSYHNHSHELVHHEGRTWLELLYEIIPAETLKAEIDTYWIAHGGGDPAQWIRRYPGRQPLLHVKDMAISPGREQRFAPVGSGNLNWDAILDAAEEAGAEYALVEQDCFYDDEDPFEEIKKSFDFLKANGCPVSQ